MPPLSLNPFHEKGYQRFSQIIPRQTVAGLHRLLASEVDNVLTRLSRFGVSSDILKAGRDIRALLGSVRSDELDHDTRVLMTGHFPTQLRLSEAFWEIPRAQALQDVLRAALGSDRLYMHMPPMARYVLPQNLEAGVPPHQDAAYNDHMSEFLTVWMPLVEITEQCGGVTIYEGRKDGLIPVTKRVHNGVWIEGVSVEDLTPVRCVPMAPGDALIFNPYVVHASMPNVSDRIRFSLDCRFFGGNAKTSKHFLDMSTWSVTAPTVQETTAES